MQKNTPEELKRWAAITAVEEIKSGMTLGLGTGSTANYAIEEIGRRLKSGSLSDISGIPSSIKTEQLAHTAGIPLLTFDDCQTLDLTIDGADEIDLSLRLIKGGGGALLREKVLAQASLRFIVIADESKISDTLGEKWALPVEVVPFAWKTEVRFIETLGAKAKLRTAADGSPIFTDQRNFLLDCDFGRINNPEAIATALSSRAGIAEHGLFIGLASQAIVAGAAGIRSIKAKV